MSLPIELQLEAAEQVRKQHDEQMRKQNEETARVAAFEKSNTSLAEACHRVQGDYLTLQGDYASLEVRLAQSEADLKRQLEEAGMQVRVLERASSMSAQSLAAVHIRNEKRLSKRIQELDTQLTECRQKACHGDVLAELAEGKDMELIAITDNFKRGIKERE